MSNPELPAVAVCAVWSWLVNVTRAPATWIGAVIQGAGRSVEIVVTSSTQPGWERRADDRICPYVSSAFAAGGASDIDILNFALTLERSPAPGERRSFDKPLSKKQVLAKAGPLIKG